MSKILGVGGIFFQCADPERTRGWYRDVLGLEVTQWGGVIFGPLPAHGQTVWNAFKQGAKHFAPSTSPWMINFLVEDIDGVLARAAQHGVEPLQRMDGDEHGRFAWLLDPDGVKVELWEPKPES